MQELGWALLGGRLVLDVVLTDPGDRPALVRVLRLEPDWNGLARDGGIPPLWGWAYRAARATVTWEGDAPTVTVNDPSL